MPCPLLPDMAYRSPKKSTAQKPHLSQALPVWTSANTDAANLFFLSLIEKLGITDVRSYFQKLRIPIVIFIVVLAWVGAVNFGLKGLFIGALLGVIAPIGVLWLSVMLIPIAIFMAIYFAAWVVIFFIVRWLLTS
jgi:hypothetical protein